MPKTRRNGKVTYIANTPKTKIMSFYDGDIDQGKTNSQFQQSARDANRILREVERNNVSMNDKALRLFQDFERDGSIDGASDYILTMFEDEVNNRRIRNAQGMVRSLEEDGKQKWFIEREKKYRSMLDKIDKAKPKGFKPKRDIKKDIKVGNKTIKYVKDGQNGGEYVNHERVYNKPPKNAVMQDTYLGAKAPKGTNWYKKPSKRKTGGYVLVKNNEFESTYNAGKKKR